MKPLDDSPLDHIKVDHERSSFLNGSEADPEDFADLPPPPMIDSKGDPYPEYADEQRTPTPPPSPGMSPFLPPRVVTPEDGTVTLLCGHLVSLCNFIYADLAVKFMLGFESH